MLKILPNPVLHWVYELLQNVIHDTIHQSFAAVSRKICHCQDTTLFHRMETLREPIIVYVGHSEH